VVGDELDVTKQIGGKEELAAIQSVTSTWLRKGGDAEVSKTHVVRRSQEKRSFNDRVNREKR
jgi:hypothetical protein